MERTLHQSTAALFIITTAVVSLLYFPTVLSILHGWIDSEAYSHGLLLLPVSIILIYLKWKQNGKNISFYPNVSVLLLIIIISAIWLLAKIGNIQIVQQLALITLFLFVPLVLFGFERGKNFVLPIALLLLAIPIWNILLIYLQTITAVIVELMLNIHGIVAIREGIIIQVPSGFFEVAESCSGLRQFIVAMIIAILFAMRYKIRLTASIIFVFLTMLLAIVVNVIRVYIVTLVGEYTHMQSPLIHDHAILGWSLFGVSIFIWMYFSAGVIQKHNILQNTESSSIYNAETGKQRIEKIGPGWRFMLILLAYASGPLLYLYLSSPNDNLHHVDYELPARIKNFNQHQFLKTNWQPVIYGEDEIYSATYINHEGIEIDVLIYRYQQQEQGKEAIHVDNRLYDPRIWKIIKQEKITIPNSSSRQFQAKVVKVKTLAGEERLIYQWYRTFKKDTANPLYAKGLNIMGSILADPTISNVIVSARVDREPVIVNQQLIMLVKAIQSNLEAKDL